MEFLSRTGAVFVLFVLAAFGVGLAGAYLIRDGVAREIKPTSTQGWLLSAQNDAERFRRLQQQLGGFDHTMWEVGERFHRLHEALLRRNFELAEYHWEKIGKTIRNGIERRPHRAANAQAMLLGGNFESIGAELEKHEYGAAAVAFERAKGVCVGCHLAENVPWVNDQGLLELALPAGGLGAKRD